MKNVKVEMNDGIFMLSARLDENSKFVNLFETNIKSIVKLCKFFLEENMERYIQIENMAGNLGALTFSAELSQMLGCIFSILKFYDLEGVYLKILSETDLDANGFINKAEDELTEYNTVSKDNPSNETYYETLNEMLFTVFISSFEFNGNKISLNEKHKELLSCNVLEALHLLYESEEELGKVIEIFKNEVEMLYAGIEDENKLLN